MIAIPCVGLVAALAAGAASVSSAPDADKPTWTFTKSVPELTDADLASLPAVPGPRWTYARTPRASWGRWLAVVQIQAGQAKPWEAQAGEQVLARLREAGIDLLAGPVDGETLAAANGPTWSHFGPEDPRVPPLLRSWVEKTGRGLTGCQLTCGFFSLDFVQAHVVEYSVRKLKGFREQFAATAKDDAGRQYVAWLGPAGAWPQPRWRTEPAVVEMDRHGPALTRQFQDYLARVYENDVARFRATARMDGIHQWHEVEAPQFEDRLRYPVLWHHWCRFRGWLRTQMMATLPARLGLVNLADEATRAVALTPQGAWAGYDLYEAALANPVVTADLGGAPGPFAAGLAALDSVLRKQTDKWALAYLDAASPVARDVSLFHRRMAQALGRLTRLRGIVLAVASADDLLTLDPKLLQALRWWNTFGEGQADLLEGLVTPLPKAATYFPRDNIFFDEVCPPDIRPGRLTDCRSRLWAHHVLALARLGYAIHVLLPQQIENGQLHDYELLFVLYGPRHTDRAIEQINQFWHDPDEIEKWRAEMRKKHGPNWQQVHKDWTNKWVFCAYDGLQQTLEGKDSGLFQRVLRTEAWQTLPRKPLWDRPGEITGPNRWYTITLASPGLPVVGTRLPSYNGMVLIQPFHGGLPYASCGGKPAICGTRKGWYIGTDLATDLALACPRHDKDPASPLQQSCPSIDPDTYGHMVDLLAKYLYLAKIHPPVKITHNGRLAAAGWASLLIKEPAGHRLVVVTNDADQPQTFEVGVVMRPEEVLADLRTGRVLEADSIMYENQVGFTGSIPVMKTFRGSLADLKAGKLPKPDGAIDYRVKLPLRAGGWTILIAGPAKLVEAALAVQQLLQTQFGPDLPE